MTARELPDTLLACTAEGRAAAGSAGCTLPRPYRAVLDGLASLDRVVPADELSGSLSGVQPEELELIVADLDAIGMVETVPVDWLVELYLIDRAACGDR